jgi:hypothetical protein
MSEYPSQTPYTPNYAPQPLQQSSSLAIASLVSGILGWFLIPIIGAIIAIITGHMAKNEIRSSGGRLSGDGMATAGLILGYVQVVLTVLGLCGFAAIWFGVCAFIGIDAAQFNY